MTFSSAVPQSLDHVCASNSMRARLYEWNVVHIVSPLDRESQYSVLSTQYTPSCSMPASFSEGGGGTIMHMNSRYESVIPASTRRRSADPKHVALIQGNKPATLEAPAKSDSRRKSNEGEKWRLRGSKGANPRASIGISQRRRAIGASSEQMSEAGSPPADRRRWMDGGREGRD